MAAFPEVTPRSEADAFAEAADEQTNDIEPFSSVRVVEDYAQDGSEMDFADITGKADGLEAAYAALGESSDDEKIGFFSLPKARENFPFGAKERPEKRKLELLSKAKALISDKAAWANAGPLAIFALLIFSMMFVVSEKPYIMRLDGNPIAFVQKKESGEMLLEKLNLEMSSPYPAEANFRQYAAIDFTRDGVKIKTKPTSEEEILDALKSGITWYVDGWTISVGNERTVYLASKSLAEGVLEDVKKLYVPEGSDSAEFQVEFVESVKLEKDEIPVDILGSPEQAFRTLTEGREPVKEYKVQSGDSYWAIADRNNMTIDELKLINGAHNDNLSIGQILKLSVPKPLLSVKTTVSMVRYEDIPFDTVYRSNGDAWQGQSKVLSNGVAGTMEIEVEVAQINGVPVAQTVLAETVVKEPVDKVVEKGAKTIVASRSDTAEVKSGMLVWPIRSKVNSPFGNRSRGFHSGIDIQAKTGDPVYSAGAGTVISASNFAGYGNQVTIDHGDGLTTMYAHLSQINVSVGQSLGVQELVGLAGTTGRTTGPHLHFEVRINKSPVNPINYLN